MSAAPTLDELRARIKTIGNPHPTLATRVDHVLRLPELCPATRNPRRGSTLTISYTAGDRFLELFSLDAYMAGFVGHTVVRDMELLVQTVALHAADAVGVPVTVCADLQYRLLRQGQRIEVTAPFEQVQLAHETRNSGV
jgi:7-cyano-7-deazaguanine reductase